MDITIAAERISQNRQIIYQKDRNAGKYEPRRRRKIVEEEKKMKRRKKHSANCCDMNEEKMITVTESKWWAKEVMEKISKHNVKKKYEIEINKKNR